MPKRMYSDYVSYAGPSKRAKYAPKVSRTSRYTGKSYRVSRVMRPRSDLYKLEDEKKGLDTRMDVPNIGNSPGLAIMDSFNRVIGGTASHQRVGRKIKMKSIRIKGVAYYSVDASTELPRDVCLRMIVVYDKQSNGTGATVGDVMVATTNDTPSENNTYFSNQLGYDDMERFVIILDKMIHLKQGGNGTGAAGVSISMPIDEFVDLKGIETTYNQDAAATNAAIQTGNLRFGFVKDVDVGENASVDFLGVARLRFYD